MDGALDAIHNDVGGGGGGGSSSSSSGGGGYGTMKQLVRKAASDDVDARMPISAGTCHD